MITLTPDSAPPVAARSGRTGPVADQYYSLVHWLRAVGDMSADAPKSVGVTGCSDGAGVSTVAMNLATAAADAGDRPVLLLDLSTTRASAATRFAMPGDLGLRDALADVPHAAEYVKPSPVANLSLLGANFSGPSPALNVDVARLTDLLQSLENDFGFIVVDLPTVESSVCFVAAGLLNGVLLVMEPERTRLETAARAKQRLMDARANVLGVILNKQPRHLPGWLEARL
jgi:Mrp family chromosome partitioning ATPase